MSVIKWISIHAFNLLVNIHFDADFCVRLCIVKLDTILQIYEVSILINIVYVNTLPITSIQAALLHWFIEPEKPSLSKRLVSQ